MNIKMMTAAVIVSSLITLPLSAGTVRVKNEKTLPIILHIIPEGKSKNNVIYHAEIPAASESGKITEPSYFDFAITPKDIDNKTYYSIQGETVPFIGDQCNHLNVSKDYQVTFQNEEVGTTCIAEEIQPLINLQ